ncbi:Prefoldin subunit-domain-containing protein [Mycena olivaceomarginata]|nr:Prefoldin subunit-domain-containing protein [Mycena olivaceomarginata]
MAQRLRESDELGRRSGGRKSYGFASSPTVDGLNATMKQSAHENDDDDAPEVTMEDQNRISTFSKLNMRIRNIEAKMQELQVSREGALDDLSTELELADEDEPVLYKVGETFLHMPLPRALKRLEKDQADVTAQVSSLQVLPEQYEKEMKELKVILYASSAAQSISTTSIQL